VSKVEELVADEAKAVEPEVKEGEKGTDSKPKLSIENEKEKESLSMSEEEKAPRRSDRVKEMKEEQKGKEEAEVAETARFVLDDASEKRRYKHNGEIYDLMDYTQYHFGSLKYGGHSFSLKEGYLASTLEDLDRRLIVLSIAKKKREYVVLAFDLGSEKMVEIPIRSVTRKSFKVTTQEKAVASQTWANWKKGSTYLVSRPLDKSVPEDKPADVPQGQSHPAGLLSREEVEALIISHQAPLLEKIGALHGQVQALTTQLIHLQGAPFSSSPFSFPPSFF
jgi:hypothetical protein